MRRHLDRGVTVALVLAAGLSAAQLTPGSVGPGGSPSPTPGTSGTGTTGTSTGTSTTPGTGTSTTPGTGTSTTPGTGTSTTPMPGTGTSATPSTPGTGADSTGGNAQTPRSGTGPPSLPPGPPTIAPNTVDQPTAMPSGKTVSPAPVREPAQQAQQATQEVTETPDSDVPAHPAPMTLAQLVERARATDSRVEEATAELRKFNALYQQARWAWFPKFEITVGLGGPVPEARNDGLGGPPTTKASFEGDLNFGHVGITAFSTGNAVLPIYTFGKLSALEKAGSRGPVVGEALRERARAEAGFQAAQAYFGYQLARSGLKQLEDVSKRLEDAAERIDALLKEESQQVSQVDTYKVRFFRQVVDARRAEALQGQQLALAAISLLSNTPAGSPVAVVEEDLPLDEAVAPPSLERALELAEQRRPELTAITAGIAAREAEVFIRERSYYPDIGLAGFYDIRITTSATRQLSPFAYDPYNDRTVGLGLVMRGTFDIPVKDAQLEQARAELDKLHAQEKQIHSGIRLEVTKVHGELVAAWARAKAYGEAEKNARRWVTAAFAAFDLGTGETRDLVDAFTAYAQASGDKSKSWFDVRLGMAALDRVTGATPASGE
ncbi:TolC family protein [Pyxidicoccus parkwayensis]|uniref:TolC family protein n=1 Tax=Pyxidicoccus parkwayensis TaxID=2813578 RepID=A0ABX7P6X6_9BACT|nr:TolC family protein [Pyxidicoccus parkwaysis]QSQ26227.1 TolC family protein [Pyxidicoccus parkwaysis]